jgi:hypothetical protein
MINISDKILGQPLALVNIGSLVHFNPIRIPKPTFWDLFRFCGLSFSFLNVFRFVFWLFFRRVHTVPSEVLIQRSPQRRMDNKSHLTTTHQYGIENWHNWNYLGLVAYRLLFKPWIVECFSTLASFCSGMTVEKIIWNAPFNMNFGHQLGCAIPWMLHMLANTTCPRQCE